MMGSRPSRMVRGLGRGVVGTAVWAAFDPVLQRIFGTDYSDVRLMGRAAARGRLRPYWPIVGLVIHLFNGALFGALFALFGGRTRRQAVAAAVIENSLLWPFMAVADRRHPDRVEGEWPRLLTNKPVIAQAYVSHILFGLVLGGGRTRKD